MTTAVCTPERTGERTTENICPPWCQGHTGTGYARDWERDGDSVFRDHCEQGTSVGNAIVMLVQRENQFALLDPSIVAVYVENDPADLTPAQARELAAVLVAAAEQAEARA